jgi:hypothetical protein
MWRWQPKRRNASWTTDGATSGQIISGAVFLEDDSPDAVGSERGGARHPQARQARRVPQQSGEYDYG